VGNLNRAFCVVNAKTAAGKYRFIGRGFGIDEAKRSVEIAHTIRNSKPTGLKGAYHPLIKLRVDSSILNFGGSNEKNSDKKSHKISEIGL
jgi:hypothetical protein